MMSLPRPGHGAREVFRLCVSRVSDPDLKARLTGAADSVDAASGRFDQATTHGKLHEVAVDEAVPTLSAAEMGKVYTQRMARRGAPGREVYDTILGAAPNGVCPLCQQRVASTLDHHLPKAWFPTLVVAPLNLVPACSDCNKAKLDTLPRRAEEVALHPYYDDIDGVVWLAAKVIESAPSAVVYRVAAPSDWDPVLAHRVRRHFAILRLGELYAAQGAEKLLNLRHQLDLVHAASGEHGVRAELLARYRSCLEARRNGWRTAAYRAWAGSVWFCCGGFAEGL
ncbi:HNH endonuclease [Humitalea sp. 24SJ18S-53]|uniref:HNH endonuclease n=1 Tax=Humitalea sp. 24SJ18S-53 TaxID=3422307 RepID=UPI003D67C89B